jgi:predicted MPP superfamily phosphohydrolase
LKALVFVVIVLLQGLLLAAHWFIYRTFVVFLGPFSASTTSALRDTLFVLAFSFLIATLIGLRYTNSMVRLIYTIASVWLGFFSFLFWAACLCRLTGWALTLAGLSADRPLAATVLFGLAVLAGLYGLLNARFIRIRRVAVQLAGLPDSWRGRTALVVSDVHLGHVHGPGFSRRIVRLAARLNPDIIFLPGDLFDGGKADAARLAEPFYALAPPLGSYFSTGNHDEYGNAARYAQVLTRAGIRVLANEKVTIDGLDIVGVSHGDSHPVRLRFTLESLHLVPSKATILLNHVPTNLTAVEVAGIGLQISGHTHAGQFFPFTWLARSVFGRFTYGLQRYGGLQVYTSSGAGTWGPPMRVGTSPEIALLTFV